MHSSQPLHFNLVAAAHAAMIEHGFQPDFPAGTDTELAAIQAHPEPPAAPGTQDLRSLLWSSIDNDTSKDLDQIEWAEQLPDGRIRVLVGVADVDARVAQGHGHRRPRAERDHFGLYRRQGLSHAARRALRGHYLAERESKIAWRMVVEFCRGRRRARLPMARPIARWCATARNWPTTAWARGLKAQARAPAKVAASADLAAQLKLQDAAAQRMVGGRFQHGALDLETIETRPVMLADQAVDIARLEKNRATSLIEEFMVAANGVIARTFEAGRRGLHPPHRAHAQALGPHRRTGRRHWAQPCPPSPTRRLSTIFCWRRSRRTPTTFPISRWP